MKCVFGQKVLHWGTPEYCMWVLRALCLSTLRVLGLSSFTSHSDGVLPWMGSDSECWLIIGEGPRPLSRTSPFVLFFQTTPSKYLWFLILFCRVHCDMPPLLPPSAPAYVPAPPRPRPGTVLIVAESRHTTRFARMSWASLVTSSLREPELASLALFPVRSLWTFLMSQKSVLSYKPR
jgi:hypothetical protein